jgi:hypothetical protein
MINGGSYSETITLCKDAIIEYPRWRHPYFLLKDIFIFEDDYLNTLEMAKYLVSEKYRIKNSLMDIIEIHSNDEALQNKDSVEKYTMILNTLRDSPN